MEKERTQRDEEAKQLRKRRKEGEGKGLLALPVNYWTREGRGGMPRQ
jgi:hypothetical protein